MQNRREIFKKYLHLDRCLLGIYSTLEAILRTEASAEFYQIIWRHIQAYCMPKSLSHSSEDPKFNTTLLYLKTPVWIRRPQP
jgi:hypothetical protein